MKSIEDMPVVVLATLGAASGLFGAHAHALGSGYGTAPEPGLYLVLAGLWFGLVVAFAVWRWGGQSALAAAAALAATWIAWELAINVAFRLDSAWLRTPMITDAARFLLTGVFAGAFGALITWAGVAAVMPSQRHNISALSVIATGAAMGMLLPLTNVFENGAVLLVPWQSAIAAVIGLNIDRARIAAACIDCVPKAAT